MLEKGKILCIYCTCQIPTDYMEQISLCWIWRWQCRPKGHKVFALVQNHKDFVRRADSLGITCIIEPYKLCARQSPDDKSKLWDFFFNLFLIRKLKKIVKKYQIDIIHSNASNVDFGAWIALFCKIPHVWHIREMLYDDYHLLYDYPRIIKFLQKESG